MLNRILLDKFDMKNFLEKRGYSIKHIGGVTEYMLNYCPFCNKEDHCGIQFSKKFFGCYKCGEKGDFIKILLKLLGLTYIQVLEFLKEGMEDEFIDLSYINLTIKAIKPYEVTEPKPIKLPDYYEPLTHEVEYTRKRGITLDQIKYYKMGICKIGKFRDRLIVCDIWGEEGFPIYWIARDITGKSSKKVLNPNFEDYGVGSGKIPWNFHLTSQYKCGILVEGIFGALCCGNNAMASYSKTIKYEHLYWLIRAGFEELIFIPDYDVSEEEVDKNSRLLNQFLPVKTVKLPYGQPDNFSRQELNKFINNTDYYKGSKVDRLRTQFK